MTTLELLDAIARHPGPLTIDDVARLTRTPRREVEAAIQQARLEGRPVVTDGGIRLATTAVETFALYHWLRRRMRTQLQTAWAMRSQAMLMERGERAARLQAVRDQQAAALAAHARRSRPTPAPTPGQTEMWGAS